MATQTLDRPDPRGPLAVRPAPRRPKRFEQVIKLPLDVRQRLRASAAYLDVEISELSEVAISSYLDALDCDRASRGESPLPRPEV